MRHDSATGRIHPVSSLERLVWQRGDALPRWQRPLVKCLQVVWAVTRDLAEGQITLRAMSLVYTSLLSLVPLLAISFSVLKGFGVHNQIEPFLLSALEPLGERRDEIVARILGFVDNVEVGVLGSVGFLLLFYTVVSLMQKIELAFNDVWQVSASRTLAERFRDYLSVVIVGPVLVFLSLGVSAAVMSDPLMAQLSNVPGVRAMLDVIGRLVPIAMTSAAFTFIYMFVPHTRVRLLPALAGGVVAGVLWNALGWLFAGFVARASRYTAIYSGFATPILFMIWLYVGWLILLIGATIAFYRQHPEYLAGRQLTGQLSPADRERLALHAICCIGDRFYNERPAPDAEAIGRELRIPAQAVEWVLTPLLRRGLITASDATPATYLPGCPWERASVYDVLEAMHHTDRFAEPTATPSAEHPRVLAILEERREVSQRAFGDVTLKQLASE